MLPFQYQQLAAEQTRKESQHTHIQETSTRCQTLGQKWEKGGAPQRRHPPPAAEAQLLAQTISFPGHETILTPDVYT